MLGASGEAHGGHAFAEAAGVDEILFQTLDLAVEQVVRHLDQADDQVGADLRIGMLDAFAEGFVAGIALAIEPA
jgi:hypothetical protein